MRTMGHHVANKTKTKGGKTENDFEILTTWPGQCSHGTAFWWIELIPAAILVVYRGEVRLTFPVSLGKDCWYKTNFMHN